MKLQRAWGQRADLQFPEHEAALLCEYTLWSTAAELSAVLMLNANQTGIKPPVSLSKS